MRKYNFNEERKRFTEVSNKDVINAFVLDHPVHLNLRLRTANIVITNPKEGEYALINYSTGIALRVPVENDLWKIYLNKKKYSVTTSKIQNMIRQIAKSGQVEIEEIDDVNFNKMGQGE